jgi:peptidoglycan/xylan/chitin deacetylase (PgdA/CDA1 family)
VIVAHPEIVWSIPMHAFMRILLTFLVSLSVQVAPIGEPPRRADETTPLRVPILMYHYISANPKWPDDPLRTQLSVPPQQFAAQLDYLQRASYTTITLDDLTAALRDGAPLPGKPLILTFDDGYEDFYTNAYPLLQQYNDKATIYIISHKVGLQGYMTWEQLRELAASPLITIGAHTRTHPALATLSAEQSWEEMAGSKTDLEGELGIAVRHLAYPYGSFSTTTLEQAQQIGFDTAVTTHEGLSHSADHILALRRVRVNGGAGLRDLIEGLAGRRARTLLHSQPSARLRIS